MAGSKVKIGVLGIGAIGSVLAAILQENKKHELFYYNRSPKTKIQLIAINEPLEISITLATPPTAPLDWLLICLKEHQFDGAKDLLRQLIHLETKVVVIRNGLRLQEPLLEFTTEEKILEGMIDCPTQPLEKGGYQQWRKPIITIAQSNLAKEFASLFSSSKVTFKLVTDFKTESWKKLCSSSALGAILCLSGETCWIFKDIEVRQLYKKLLQEIVEVAKADGALIVDDFVTEMLAQVLNYPPDKGSSMLTDRLQGNPIELGAKNGIIAKLGKQYQIKTPINDWVVMLLTFTNNRV